MTKNKIPRYIYKFFQKNHKYCQNCGKKFALRKDGMSDLQYLYNRMELHHKKRVKNGGTNEISNLEPLCGFCHYEEHLEEFTKADFFMKRFQELIEREGSEMIETS